MGFVKSKIFVLIVFYFIILTGCQLFFNSADQEEVVLLSLTIEGQVSSKIEEDQVYVTMSYGTDLRTLKVFFELNRDVDSNFQSGTIQDFSSPKELVLKENENNIKKYIIIVQSYSWELVSGNPGFNRNDGAGLLSFGGKLWMLGGWQGSPPLWTRNDK